MLGKVNMPPGVKVLSKPYSTPDLVVRSARHLPSLLLELSGNPREFEADRCSSRASARTRRQLYVRSIRSIQ